MQNMSINLTSPDFDDHVSSLLLVPALFILALMLTISDYLLFVIGRT
jgi:hypothetical protein